ncbi:MAG: DUF523 domain-containing protein [Candidatus Poribacteria bacterium]|nr:DUF523 domain-containing protein [Candidatus Poribacteria bacterium]
MKKVIVSACLIGVKCRYNGLDSKIEQVASRFGESELIPICPEQMGGLPTPRPPAEVVGGDGDDVLDGKARVITADGEDKTEAFLRGAYRALKIAQAHGATHAILKSKSPSCGCGQIYDGSFAGNLTDGDGVTAALFRRHGIKIITEKELDA